MAVNRFPLTGLLPLVVILIFGGALASMLMETSGDPFSEIVATLEPVKFPKALFATTLNLRLPNVRLTVVLSVDVLILVFIGSISSPVTTSPMDVIYEGALAISSAPLMPSPENADSGQSRDSSRLCCEEVSEGLSSPDPQAE